MKTLESANLHPIHGYADAPITYWPVAEFWDIPNLLEADNFGQVVLPQPTRIPVEQRAQQIQQEIRLRFQERAEKAAEQWKPVYWQAVAQKQAQEAQWEKGYRAAQAQQTHERKMAEMTAQLQQREAEAREREQLLATQQELSLLRQAQRATEAEERLIEAQTRREQIEEMKRRAPQTPALPPATRPETPAVTPPITQIRPVTPAALTPPGTPPATPATRMVSYPQAITLTPVVAPREQRITGGVPVPVRASAPAGMPTRATLEAAYQIQLSRMYPSAGDMQAAREMQIRAAQLSGLGQYPRGRGVRRIDVSREFQPRRQPNPYVRQWKPAQHIPRRRTPTPTARQRTPVFQPMTRRPRVATRTASRPRTGQTVGQRRAISRRSPLPRITRDIMSALRAHASRQRRSA